MASKYVMDFDYNPVVVGSEVAFICAYLNDKGFTRYTIEKGVITRFTEISAFIYCENKNKEYRIQITANRYKKAEKPRLRKVALLKCFHQSDDPEVRKDALGQTITDNDTIAYMAPLQQNYCEGFIKATVTGMTNLFIELDYTKKKSAEKLVKIG